MAKNITYEERFTIECMLNANHKVKHIAVCLNRSYKTILREISRCLKGLYNAAVAHLKASKSMIRKDEFTLSNETESYIKQKLINDKWSPEIISQRLKLGGYQAVSHTFIYSYIKKDKQYGGNLYLSLAHYGKYKNKHEYKGSIKGRVSIHERSDTANERTRVGDVEVDLIVSPKNKGSSIVSIIDRKSRYCSLKKVFDKTKEIVKVSVISSLQKIGFTIYTITSDNGNEFTDHVDIKENLQAKYYFADPYASYQRGSIEQLNGLVRRFIPKGTQINDIGDKEIEMVEYKLNTRPRKILGWLSPIEYLRDEGINFK